MMGVRNNSSMEMIERAYNDLHSGKKAVVIVLIHKPGCPHCRDYYSQFNELCEKLPGLCGGKGAAMSIDFDEASDEMRDETDFVPRVVLSESKGDGTSRKLELDDTARKIDVLIPIIEKIMSKKGHDIPQPVILPHLSPMIRKESKSKRKATRKKGKGKGGATRGKGKGGATRGKKRGKEMEGNGRNINQEGRGFVEAALATAILGAGANITNQSVAVKKYLKQAEDGIIGLSKASGDLAKGSFKVLTEQDMMKKLANVTKTLTTRRRKTRKNKRKGKRSQK